MSPPNENICDCENPPGGKVTCPANMVAICRVLDGQPIGECVDPAQFGTLGPEYATLPIRAEDVAWLVWLVTRRLPEKPMLQDNIDMLLSGRYDEPERNYVVTFRMPEHIRRRLDAASSRGGSGGTMKPELPPKVSPPKVKRVEVVPPIEEKVRVH